MEVETHQIPVMGSVEGLAHQIGLVGEVMDIWDDRCTRSQNHSMLGQPGNVRMTLLHKSSEILLITYPWSHTRGKTYRSRYRFSQDTSGHPLPKLWVRDWGHKLGQFVVPVGKDFHLLLMPLQANLIEYLLKEGPFCLT